MLKTNAFRLAIFGLITGILSGLFLFGSSFFGPTSSTLSKVPDYLLGIIGIILIPLFLIRNPGILFGIGISIYFVLFLRYRKSLLRLIFWIAASQGSYHIAVRIATLTFRDLRQDLPSQLTMITAGTVGAFLMLLGFCFLLYKLNVKHIISLSLLGGLLSLSFYVSPYFLPLYVFWQTGMAAAIGWVMDSSLLQKQIQNNSQNDAQ